MGVSAGVGLISDAPGQDRRRESLSFLGGIEMSLEICLAGFAGKVFSFAGAAGRFRVINSITGGLFVSAGAFLLTMEQPK